MAGNDVSKPMPTDAVWFRSMSSQAAKWSKKFAQNDPSHRQSHAFGKLFFGCWNWPVLTVGRTLCDAVGVTPTQLPATGIETNSALLPMFFYFVFFWEGVSAVSKDACGGRWRHAAGCRRLKASEKYFAKMVDSKKNRD